MNVSMDDRDIERIALAVAERIQQPPENPWLDAAEAADYLRCSRKHIDRLAYLGRIPTFKPAGKRLFKRADLDALVHQTEET